MRLLVVLLLAAPTAFGCCSNTAGTWGACTCIYVLQVPLLLTPEAKCRILAGEASVQKQQIVQSVAVSGPCLHMNWSADCFHTVLLVWYVWHFIAT